MSKKERWECMFNLFSLFSEIKIKINMKIHKNDRKVETAPL